MTVTKGVDLKVAENIFNIMINAYGLIRKPKRIGEVAASTCGYTTITIPNRNKGGKTINEDFIRFGITDDYS